MESRITGTAVVFFVVSAIAYAVGGEPLNLQHGGIIATAAISYFIWTRIEKYLTGNYGDFKIDGGNHEQ